jgi:hypothetical protein
MDSCDRKFTSPPKIGPVEKSAKLLSSLDLVSGKPGEYPVHRVFMDSKFQISGYQAKAPVNPEFEIWNRLYQRGSAQGFNDCIYSGGDF